MWLHGTARRVLRRLRALRSQFYWPLSAGERELRASRPPAGRHVSIFVASLNTLTSTELCIRTMRQLAGYPFDLTVGDCGSSDGSLELLRSMEADGWLRLEVAPRGRSHAAWLDHWRKCCDADLAVFVDSDIEFRRHGWLRDLVTVADLRQAALVCAELLPEARNAIEPVGRRTVRGRPRPSPWLLMIDVGRTAAIPVGFGFDKAETDLVPEGLIIWDVGARFLESVQAAGLNWTSMPASYRRKFHHYGGLSWIPLHGKRGQQKARDLQTIARRLSRVRRQAGGELLHV